MYLIILSNTPAHSFPDNTSANFTVPLTTPLRTPFQEKWKVGLLEVLIPNTIYNIEAGENIFIEFENGETSVFEIKEGRYTSVKKIAKHLDHRALHFTTNRGGLCLTMSDDVKKINISANLGKILGYKHRDIFNNIKGEKIISPIQFDPWINHRILLVHSNLVKPSQVNDQQMNILQSLSPDNYDFHCNTNRTYFPPDYLEIQGEYYNSLSFKITDIENNPIKFRAGSVILLLELING